MEESVESSEMCVVVFIMARSRLYIVVPSCNCFR